MSRSKEDILSQYIPVHFVPDIIDLLGKYPVRFRIVKPRKSKLGDFKYNPNRSKYEITVNGDLNPYAFLITTLHEFAHLIAYDQHGMHILPHGSEWKNIFSTLLQPLIDSNEIPNDLRKVLSKSVRNVKASSCTDHHLQRVLMRYDSDYGLSSVLEELDKNSIFELNGKQFIKGHLRRTRFVCTDTKSGRQYLINALAQVKQVVNE